MSATTSAKKKPRPSYETSPVVYAILKWIITRLMHILYRYEVTGQENFPLSGPTMIVVNHLHLFDPGAVAPVVPRRIVTLAAGKWRTNILIRSFLRLAGAIFIRRGEVDRQALRACIEVLSKGGVLAIAPEGTRSKTATLQRAKPGVAYLATRMKSVLVPVAFWGIEKLGDWKRLKRPTCKVVIGRPFRLPRTSEKPSIAELQELADLVSIQIGLLLPERYRGVYTERIAAIEAGENPGMLPVPVQ